MKSFSQTYSCLYITKITLSGKSLFRRKGGGLLLLCFIFLLPINTSAESGFFQAVYQNLKSEILSGKAQGPTNPTVSVFAFQPSCTNDIPNADGYLQLSAVVDGDAYRWSEGSTFDDMGGTNAYAGAPSLTSASYPLIFATGQTNPTGSRDYTVRVYNGSDACFTDVTLTMNEQDCSFGCSCTDYVYSNDLSGDLVHKFEVNSVTGAVSEVGSPWLPNGVSPLNPHGPAPDINGNLFVSEQNGTEALYIYNCDGEILNGGTPLLEGTPLGLRNNNFGSFNEYIYFGLDPGLDPTDEVVLVSSCDGTIEGRMSLPFGVNLNAWGFYVDKFSERWYIANRDNKVYSGSLNPDLYTSPASDSARYEFDLNFGSPMGITLDEQGNFYIIEDQNIGGTDNGINPGNVLLVKYDAAGNYVSDVEDASFTGNYTTDGQSGFSRTRGLVYSALSQRLYLSGRENCITVFDKNLVEEPALNIGNPSNGAAKGVALSTQCCPTSNNVKIDTVLCSGGLGTTFSLQNLINCQGSVCEGEWTPDAGNTGLIYNSCNNSITVSASNACGRFTLESDGLGTNPECGAFKIEVNVEVGSTPTAQVFAIQPSCTSGIPGNDGYLQLSSISGSSRINWSPGSTYSGDLDPNNAIDVSGVTFPYTIVSNLNNPSGSQDYTVRIFNEVPGCTGGCTEFRDITLTMNEQDCVLGCDCTDNIYLNDVGRSEVHKFRVNPTTGISEIGSPWVSGINQPHGVGMDVNGFVYIGEFNNAFDSYTINKLTCDGTFVDSEQNGMTNDWFVSTVGGGFNLGSVDGRLYIYGAGNVNVLNTCDGTVLGCINIASTGSWGMSVDAEGNLLATDGWQNAENDLISAPSDLAVYGTGGACNPAGTFIAEDFVPDATGTGTFNQVFGVTQAADGNYYVVVTENTETWQPSASSLSTSSIYRIEPDGTTTLIATDDMNDGSGFYATRGIVYSEESGYLFLASFENCIYAMDLNGNPAPSGFINTEPGEVKGVGILKECCPTNNNMSIDTVLCGVAVNEKLFLQELINCEGTICEGMWAAAPGNTGLSYDPCDNSVTLLTPDACGSFLLESDGLGNNPQCGAFRMEVNISVNVFNGPQISGDQALCTGDDPLAFTVTTPASGGDITYQWESSTTDCTTGFTEIPGAVSAVYDAPVLTGTTYFRLITRSQNAGCPLSMCVDTTDCLTLSVSGIANADLQNVVCNTNGTRTDSADDFTSFSLTPVGTSGGTYNLVVSSGSVSPNSGTYDIETTFNLQAGSPGAGDITLTLTDANDSSCPLTVVIPDPGSCAAREDYPDYEDSSNPCADLPCHTVSNDIYLGSGVTNDVAGSGGSGADTDIDDGVGLSPIFDAVPGNTINLPFTVFNNTGNDAYLRAWIDWNGDGDFDDTGEQIMDATYSFATYSGSFTDVVNVPVPVDVVQNQDLGMRWRVSTDDANSAGPCGTGTCAADGEIEDFLLRFTCKESICLPVSIQVRN